ncbi:LysM peptidoglycan-binding domain-containing protein [Ornithinimicrobium avium]|uniref:LysM peptidoglycan-binding domain-containing protein n=1 Tax=Ornithinimicrobium avium TaxID=2283195 RepID=A0A345NME0_9MICO|nr:Gmad2 immunoglobulin-like domain-containing protein [Ornithinimicrobium avium]AXH96198.1 LysM peptidoglycan-binding domain-containing protein [Ornithinimicrobium avium]
MSIDVQQPRRHDIVGRTVLVAGTAGGAFEASYVVRVTDGHDEVTQAFMAGDGVGGHGQFQVRVDVSGAGFSRAKAKVEVFHSSARDGSELDRVVVPVVLGGQVVSGYTSYLEHVVVAGETLWAIAQHYYGDGARYHRLVTANPRITDPDVIHPGDVLRVPRAL